MNFKKTIILCLSLLVIAGCAVSGTFAFPNLLEKILPANEVGEETVAELKISLDIQWDPKAQMLPGLPLKKEVSISNSDESPESVYVWYTCTLPSAMFTPDNLASSPMTGSFKNNTGWMNCYKGYDGAAYKLSDDGKLVEFTCLYSNPVPPGGSTEISLESVTLDYRIDRDENGFSWVENSVSTPLGYSEDTVKMAFKAYAISVEEFSGVEEAYETFEHADENTPTAVATN